MTDARKIISRVVGSHLSAEEVVHHEHECVTDDILAALADAGLKIIDRSKFKIKLNTKAMKYLDGMAEAEIAMDGRHDLSILLAHYRAMLEAATDE